MIPFQMEGTHCHGIGTGAKISSRTNLILVGIGPVLRLCKPFNDEAGGELREVLWSV